jgi:hypothetical protein
MSPIGSSPAAQGSSDRLKLFLRVMPFACAAVAFLATFLLPRGGTAALTFPDIVVFWPALLVAQTDFLILLLVMPVHFVNMAGWFIAGLLLAALLRYVLPHSRRVQSTA